jgi:2,4-dienoyl-CoA reductase (NADPH2)
VNLLAPLPLGPRTAPNRILFGPHETNLGWGRAVSSRHAEYYRARAAGGCGTIVIEQASVHPTDWPYERCPSADEAATGWAEVVAACRPHGSLVVAGLNHAGGQGSSAYSQRELWSPSDEPEVNSREVPKIMEGDDIDAVVTGFARSALAAAEAGLDGVEVNAGQHSLIRQFLSGLTNRRDDAYGTDRTRFAREVLTATRIALGTDRVLGLRLCGDELAPWAGITPDAAVGIATELVPLVDYLVIVRGSIFTAAETRPTGHHRPGFNLGLTASIRAGIDGAIPVLAQGSLVDPEQAEAAVADGACDGVEMTRAQIADPNLVAAMRAGRRPRPCVLCNQLCWVRDSRNPIVSCVAEPRAGHETIDPPVEPDDLPPATTRPAAAPRHRGRQAPRPVLVIGAGPAGLEAARVAALRSRPVTMIDRADAVGGTTRLVAHAPGHARFALLVAWLAEQCLRLGVESRLGTEADPNLIDAWDGPVIVATGSRQAPLGIPTDTSVPVIPAVGVLAAIAENRLDALLPSSVTVWDPIGASTGVAMAELAAAAGRVVSLVTPDAVAATLTSRTGDLAPANVRLHQAGVELVRRSRPRRIEDAAVEVEHLLTAALHRLEVGALIDCSPRLPEDSLWEAIGHRGVRVGDVVAARTVAEAIREGRSAALSLDHLDLPATATGAQR